MCAHEVVNFAPRSVSRGDLCALGRDILALPRCRGGPSKRLVHQLLESSSRPAGGRRACRWCATRDDSLATPPRLRHSRTSPCGSKLRCTLPQREAPRVCCGASLTACVPVTAQQLATWVASLEQKLLLASPRQAAAQLLPAAAPGPAPYLANKTAPTYQKPAAYLANKAAPTYQKPSAYLLNAGAPTAAVASSVAGSVASAGIATAPAPSPSPAGIAAAAGAAGPKSVPRACAGDLISPRGNEPTPYSEPAAAINALLQRLTVLDTAAAGRPVSAPVRYNAMPTARPAADDAASVASWSADAFGRSKTPGWYHGNRKQLYARKAKMEAEAPAGCFTSHSRYAAEASRIKSTGRLAF